MRYPEEEFIAELQQSGVDPVCTLPCDRFKRLISLLPYGVPEESLTVGSPKNHRFFGAEAEHIPLTREEEGVGICAGAALAGRRPAIILQNSGIGNMINALLSLTGFYQLPLALFVSHRGVYKEKIAAQMPMGRRLPGILKGAGIGFSLINDRADIKNIGKKLNDVYRKNSIHAFLLSPKVWEATADCAGPAAARSRHTGTERLRDNARIRKLKPIFTRYEVLEIIAPWLEGRVVVCNLGFPSKELFYIRHQPSNFYMLGSMGMATPIGLASHSPVIRKWSLSTAMAAC